MVPCVVMGDSLAVGVGMYRPDCESAAKSGINSKRYVQTLLSPQNARTVVISLGVNDDDTMPTIENLRTVREKVQGETVYWLLPGIKDRARMSIATVARQFGDFVIDTRPQAGPDHLHPTGAGYKQIAALTSVVRPSALANGGRPGYRPMTVARPFHPNSATFTIWHGTTPRVYRSP